MGNSCICLYVMENDLEGCMDSGVSSWCVFYLKCDKGRESSSYQVYIKLCYSYVLVFFFLL
jgi:hypothetical protein